MDVLSHVLDEMRLGSSILNHSELLAPWGLEVGPTVKAAVHIVQRGICWLRVGRSSKPLRLGAGDVVLLPRGTRHALTDDPRTRPVPYQQGLAAMRARVSGVKPGAEMTQLLCAEYAFEQEGNHPFLSALPELIHLPADAADGDGSVHALARLLLREGTERRAGHELVVPRLVDTLLVFIVRSWLDRQPLEQAGWFSALHDSQIGRALALIHEAPEHRWTVAELAHRVGQSRAAFARRFTALVEEPPLTYVARWRVNLAAKLLRTTDDSAERIGAAVGYVSPTAFGTAFRRYFSVAPGQYRARKRSGVAANA